MQAMNEIRMGLRLVAREPRFALLVCITLGVAIGASTIIFTVVNGLVIQPLPFGNPDRVVLVFSMNLRQNVSRGTTSMPDFLDWRAASTSFEELAAGDAVTSSMTTPAGPLPVRCRRVTANAFRAWGLQPILGRTFSPGEDRPDSAPVAVLSHGFWAQQFGSDPGIIGRNARLDGRIYTIVGVLTPEIEIGDLSLIDIWVPLPVDAGSWPRDRRTLQVTGLIKPHVTVSQADAELRVISRGLAGTYRDTNTDWAAHVLSFSDGMAAPETWLVLGLCSFAVALVLLVGCANVASFMLARGIDRRREIAVRLALGASRGQIVRPMVIEAFLLAAAGGVAGLVLAYGGLHIVKAVTFHPFFRQVAVDFRVLGFVTALALTTPLLFGLGPALNASNIHISTAIQAAGSASLGTARGQRCRGLLVVAQIATALTLLIACVVTVRAAVRLGRSDLGFETSRILILRADLPESKYGIASQIIAFQEQLLERLSRLPGSEGVAAASRLPVVGTQPVARVYIQGDAAGAHNAWATPSPVSPDYFTAMRIPLLSGRPFSRHDTADTVGAAILSDDVARRYWGTPERALHTRIRLGNLSQDSPWLEVVGIVGDVRAAAGDAPRAYVYVPMAQRPERNLSFVVRTSSNPGDLAAEAREAVRAVDPELAVYDIRTVDQALVERSANERLVAAFFTAFAVVALVLASVGLHGLMSYSVRRRTGEIGLRIVLGARPVDILRMVLLQGVRLTVAGIAIGGVAAYVLAWTMKSVVRGAEGVGPSLYFSLALLLVAIAGVAAYLPARHAMRLDPTKALRSE